MVFYTLEIKPNDFYNDKINHYFNQLSLNILLERCGLIPIEQVNKLHYLGYHVILFTARYGDREDGCLQRIYKRGYLELLDALDKHGVKYGEVWLGKPAGALYIDDKAARVSGDTAKGWVQVWKEVRDLKHKDKYGQPK